MGGLLGHGDSFVMRDPVGIRPAFYYKDEEVVVVASERPAIQNAFNIDINKIKELDPGSAIIIKNKGEVSIKKINKKANILLTSLIVIIVVLQSKLNSIKMSKISQDLINLPTVEGSKYNYLFIRSRKWYLIGL